MGRLFRPLDNAFTAFNLHFYRAPWQDDVWRSWTRAEPTLHDNARLAGPTAGVLPAFGRSTHIYGGSSESPLLGISYPPLQPRLESPGYSFPVSQFWRRYKWKRASNLLTMTQTCFQLLAVLMRQMPLAVQTSQIPYSN
jgi:hypothetical protein